MRRQSNAPRADFTVLEPVDETHVRWKRKVLIYFGGCDYFRLSYHPTVRASLVQAVTAYGLNVAASRITTGNHPVYEHLEKALAKFFKAEAALLVSTGYMANLVVLQSLGDEYAGALIDKQTHASMQDAVRYLKGGAKQFEHRDAKDLACKMKQMTSKGRILVMTDGMFAHDGDVAPVAAYLSALKDRGTLLVDEAHSAGVLGKHGGGLLQELGINSPNVLRTITLSKAFGLYGGAILGSAKLIGKIRATSRAFAGSTPIPLPFAAAAIQALRLMRTDRLMRRRLHENTLWLKTQLKHRGWKLPENASPIVGFNPSSTRLASKLRARLLGRGIYPSFIRYTGGPPAGYFRFAISSAHSARELENLVAALTG